jgi:antitoxin component of RelBE/YafQ-DinJ toxin-antitoxin module
MEQKEAAFVEVRLQEDLHKYLEAIAGEVGTDVSTLVSSLVFDGLAYNILRNLVEEHGLTLDEVVVRFLNSAVEADGKEVVFDEDSDTEEGKEEVVLDMESSNGEGTEVDVELEE